MSVGTARHLLRSEPPMIAIRYSYEIQAIETWNLDEGDLTTIIWERDDGPDAITEAEIPY